MTTFLIISIIVVIVLMIVQKIRRFQKQFDGMDLPEIARKLDDMQAECDEKIKKIEQDSIQKDYDKVKLKTGKYVHNGKMMQLEFLFKDSKSRVLLNCFKDILIMNVPGETEVRKYSHMDDFFRDDLPNGINLKRDWLNIIRINYYELKNM